jgi:predicted nucleic acid-binding protein
VTIAYVDTSVLIAVLLDQPGGKRMARAIRRLKSVFSSNLLEAELRSVLARERVDPSLAAPALQAISWVMPRRPLTTEIRKTLEMGYLRGADLWHLACALYLAETPANLTFLTLDNNQKTVASSLGFPVEP